MAQDTGRFDGKVALVTGGSSGIGLATARRLADEGARVFITGRRRAEIEAAAKSIGHDCTAIQSDVSNTADLDRTFEEIRRDAGRLDILFVNAGVYASMPLSAVTEEEFDREFDINVRGALFTVQRALPLLGDGASIILNASVVSAKGFYGSSVYSATKAALRSFARTWTTELKDRHIRVNVVSPGPIDTPGLEEFRHAAPESVGGHLTDAVPMGRMGEPDDIAKAVSFLASDDSRYVTGVELFVDGGMTAV
jgi:NAD(P)-dependent dehydrogenase (short-subunit alcohol dehydrogenase family)